MWQAPYRPNGQITQAYADGVLTVYAVENAAKPGYKPVERLSKKITLRYAEMRVGLQRYYTGMQNQIQIDRVVRTPRAGAVTSQDVGITEDGRQYRIDLVQTVDNVYPPSIDITLARIDQVYTVPEGDTEEGGL